MEGNVATAAEDAAVRVGVLSYDECIALRVPYYCEENVWHILKLAAERGVPADDLCAVFISNPQRCIPFQMQKAATAEANGVCLWDYHVIAVIVCNGDRDKRSVLVYDVDSTLPFPSSLANYVDQSITRTLPNGITYKQLGEQGVSHQFRVVKYSEMLRLFSSDRRHMFSPRGTWQSSDVPEYMTTPPKTPCIRASRLAHPHSLPLFLKMSGSLAGDAFALDDSLREVRSPGLLIQHVADLFDIFNVGTE